MFPRKKYQDTTRKKQNSPAWNAADAPTRLWGSRDSNQGHEVSPAVLTCCGHVHSATLRSRLPFAVARKVCSLSLRAPRGRSPAARASYDWPLHHGTEMLYMYSSCCLYTYLCMSAPEFRRACALGLYTCLYSRQRCLEAIIMKLSQKT